MSEFIWPPPDDQLDLTSSESTPPRSHVRRRRSATTRQRHGRGRHDHGGPAGFAWPPTDDELVSRPSVSASAQDELQRLTSERGGGEPAWRERWRKKQEEARAYISHHTTRLAHQVDTGRRTFPHAADRWRRRQADARAHISQQTIQLIQHLRNWRATVGPAKERVTLLAVAIIVLLVSGGVWQMASSRSVADEQAAAVARGEGAQPEASPREIGTPPPPSTPAEERSTQASTEENIQPEAPPREIDTPASSSAPPEERPPQPSAAAVTAVTSDNERATPSPTRGQPASASPPDDETEIATTAQSQRSANAGGDIVRPLRTAPSELTPSELTLSELTPSEQTLPEPSQPNRPRAEARLSTARIGQSIVPPQPATTPLDVSALSSVEGASSARRDPATPARPAAVQEDRTAIRGLVDRYKAAFDELDAEAAAALWPSVDAGALARAFADVEQQQLTFDRCEVAVGSEQATASCQGTLSYVGRVGRPEPRVERAAWTFRLERNDNGWQIARVVAR